MPSAADNLGWLILAVVVLGMVVIAGVNANFMVKILLLGLALLIIVLMQPR